MWTVAAELLPDAVRASAMGCAIVLFWVTSFLLTQSLESLLDSLSPQGAFGLFALGCVGALGFVACWLPETKGMRLASCALDEAELKEGVRLTGRLSEESHASGGGVDSDDEDWDAVKGGARLASSPRGAQTAGGSYRRWDSP